MKIFSPDIQFKESALRLEREHIPLYSAVMKTAEGLFLVWYEYGSSTKPAPSDLFCARIAQAPVKRTAEARITTGDDYDNGPSLCPFEKDQYLLAWHSWRAPGSGPFTPDSRRNIWILCARFDDTAFPEPALAFPGEQATSYPSLVRTHENNYAMSFTIEESMIAVSYSENGTVWQKPQKLFPGFRSELIQDRQGQFHLIIENKEGLWIHSSTDGHAWGEPRKLTDIKGSRPKVSETEDGYTVLYHSNQWGKHSLSFETQLSENSLCFEIHPGKSAGNAHWALSGVQIRQKGKELESISFDRENMCHYFFDPVDFQERMLGGGIIHSSRPARFRHALPEGSYEIQIDFQSWIASAPDADIRLPDQRILQPTVSKDRVYLQFSQDCLDWSDPVCVTPPDFDHNRPSNLCLWNNRYLFFCNAFDGTHPSLKAFESEIVHD